MPVYNQKLALSSLLLATRHRPLPTPARPGAKPQPLPAPARHRARLHNYFLRALKEKGWVKAENFRNRQNKSAYFYNPTPAMVTEKARIMWQLFSGGWKSMSYFSMQLRR